MGAPLAGRLIDSVGARRGLLGSVPKLTASDVDAAVAAAKRAMHEQPLPQWRRAEILDKAVLALTARQEEFARCIALEAAKPIKTARAEAQRAISTLQFSASVARSLAGEVVPLQQPLADLAGVADGELVHGLSVLLHEVLALVHRLARGRAAAAAGGHLEEVGSRAVDFVQRADETFAFVGGLDQHGARLNLATGLGVAAARQGHRVLFASASEWVIRLSEAHARGELTRELNRLRRYPLLIIDEVMTGFRVAYGGAQALHDIVPDLTCIGKVVGGGLPAAAFGGRATAVKMCGDLGIKFDQLTGG